MFHQMWAGSGQGSLPGYCYGSRGRCYFLFLKGMLREEEEGAGNKNSDLDS